MWTDLPAILQYELEKAENADIVKELEDEQYISRTHYSRATYAEGCHGPLCRKAERDRGRERNEERAKAAGRTYIPRENLREQARDGLLALVTSWHMYHPENVERRAKARADAAAAATASAAS